MAASRYFWRSVLTLALVLTVLQAAYSQVFTVPARPKTAGSPSQKARHTDGRVVCKVYNLRDLGMDPELGKWIAQTIPALIQPGEWSGENAGAKQANGHGKLVYNASAQLLVVKHNAAVHQEVEAFLKEVKQGLVRQHSGGTSVARTRPANELVPAGYSSPAVLKPAADKPDRKSSYLIPAPAKQPKHLFHLVIRYEGNGVIDANVGDLFKSLYGQEEDGKTKAQPSKDSEATPKAQSGGAAAPNQLFNFILRYEGEGIIDSTIAGLVKDLYQQMNGPAASPPPPYSAAAGALPFFAPARSAMNVGVPAGPPTPVNGEIKLADGKGQVESELVAADPSDRVQQQSKCKVFTVALKAGRTYQIEMVKKAKKDGKRIPNPGHFDPFLRLENSAGTQLMTDDDSAGDLNARIVFSCQQDGSFRIVATSLQGTGHFTLKVRENTGAPAYVPAGVPAPYNLPQPAGPIPGVSSWPPPM